MDAKEYLGKIERMETIIQNKIIEREQWLTMANRITTQLGGERVQATGGKSRMALAVEKAVDMEREINRMIDNLVDTKRSVIATMERVENPTWYNILHMRYVQRIPLKEIASLYDKDYGWVTTCHGRALKAVQDILDGK